MTSAQIIPAVIVVQPPSMVTMTMTLAQAETLRCVCSHIGGDNPRRHNMDELAKALDGAGVKNPCHVRSPSNNAIYFL